MMVPAARGLETCTEHEGNTERHHNVNNALDIKKTTLTMSGEQKSRRFQTQRLGDF